MAAEFDFKLTKDSREAFQKAKEIKQDLFVNEENIIKTKTKFDEESFIANNIYNISRALGPAIPNNYSSISANLGNKKTGGAQFLINSLVSKGFKDFWNITTVQQSALVPTLRIFKVFKNKKNKKTKVEFIFDNKFPENDASAILSDNFSRGGGAGIKSFEWEDDSTQYAESKFTFKSRLEMFFQSPKAFFEKKSINVDGVQREISFSDLVSYPPTEKLKNLEFNPKYFEIHVLVGWSVPSYKQKLFSEELLNQIHKTQINLILILARRVISPQQNGNFVVTANYVGRAEATMRKASTDILFVNSDDKNKTSESINARIENKERFINREQQEVARVSNNLVNNTQGKSLSQSEQESLLFVTQNNIERINRYQRDLEILNVELSRVDKTISHQRLIKSLITNNLIYPIEIDKNQIEIENNKLLTIQEKINKLTKFRNQEKVWVSRDSSHLQQNSSQQLKKINDYINSIEQDAKDLAQQEFFVLNSDNNKPKSECSYLINFVRFGDILDVALNVLYKNKNYLEDENENDISIILGSIYIEQIINNKKKLVQIPLKDIPVSLNLFIKWWFEHVIKTSREKYFLHDFIRDVLNTLIINILSPHQNSNINNNSLRPSIVSLNLRKNATEFLEKGNVIKISDIKQDKILANEDVIDPNNIREVLLIHISNFNVNFDSDSIENDHNRGVYHFVVGSPVGLLKQIEFDQVSLQYFIEANIVNQYKSDLQGATLKFEPFNAKIDMIGNNLFKNGCKIYVEPNSLGLGFDDNNFDLIKIGGYYDVIKVTNKITSKEFTTNLDCVSQGTVIESREAILGSDFDNSSVEKTIGEKL